MGRVRLGFRADRTEGPRHDAPRSPDAAAPGNSPFWDRATLPANTARAGANRSLARSITVLRRLGSYGRSGGASGERRSPADGGGRTFIGPKAATTPEVFPPSCGCQMWASVTADSGSCTAVCLSGCRRGQAGTSGAGTPGLARARSATRLSPERGHEPAWWDRPPARPGARSCRSRSGRARGGSGGCLASGPRARLPDARIRPRARPARWGCGEWQDATSPPRAAACRDHSISAGGKDASSS